MTTPKKPTGPDGVPTAVAEPTALPPLEGRQRLTPAQVETLNRVYADVVHADDEDAKALTRRIIARLRRCSHEELHPGCQRVVVDVPAIEVASNQGTVRIPVLLNDKPYVGVHEVWMCEAQQLLHLVQQARAVESARMKEDGSAKAQNTYDLDRGGLAERARAIQSA